MKPGLALSTFLPLAILFSACTPAEGSNAPTSPQPALATPSMPASSPPITTGGEIDFASNRDIRTLPTPIDLAAAAQINIPLAGRPAWVAGIPHENGSAWAVALEDGSLQAFFLSQNDYTTLEIFPDLGPPGMPLTIYSKNGALFALAPGSGAASYSEPLLFEPPHPGTAFIAANGDLVIQRNGLETRLPVDALPDSRILDDGSGRLLFLSSPTARYDHGVLGDSWEAAGVTLVETAPEPRVAQTISIPDPDVIEGIYPVWADLDNDGEREIIVTLSNAQTGARMAAFREDGSPLAEGPPLGSGYRWRHPLVVAPFGAGGESLLAVVRTPHIGGVLEFYRLDGNKLVIVAEIPGISTHTIGSRNLFTALAGDFDDDGQVELLAPDQAHTRLGIIDTNGETTWLDLGAELDTNLAAVDSPASGRPVIAAGLSNHSLRLWLP